MSRQDRSGDAPKSAAELMAELQQDPAFLVRLKQEEEERLRNLESYRMGARGVVKDLAEAGFEVEAVGDLRRTSIPYPEAVPVLIRWLDKVHDTSVKEDIVRTLSVPWAREALPALLSELQRVEDPSDTGLSWAIANAVEVLADDSVFEQIAALVRDRRYGRAREMLALALAKMTDPKVIDLLVELLQDDQIAGHALSALAVLRARVDPVLISPFVKHTHEWVRKEAKKVLANSQPRPRR